MSEERARRPSIRRQMLLFISSALLVMVAGAAVVTYVVALHSANNAYDRSLLDPVLDIANNVRIDAGGAHVDLPQKALDALVFDQADKVLYQVRSPQNAIIEGAPDLPPPPPMAAGQHIFFDGSYAGEPLRVAAMRTASGFVIQVGETLHKRNRLIGEILIAELVSNVMIAIVCTALAWLGVGRGLLPLQDLRADLLSRGPRDLRPLAEGAAPEEIAPLVNAFNRLLGRLREAITTQQRFLANAAHQLRTPLAGLQMHLELLLRREVAGEVRTELERIHGATVRASRLANQLLALAKAESPPDQERASQLVDLSVLADNAARDWTPEALNRRIDLGFSLESAPVRGDAVLLAELVDNLIDNALRYTPSGGSVTVNTGRSGEIPYFSVEDTGPGIPAAERIKVRERFYRIPGTPGDGSGLGLAIAQEVVDRHSGVLEIETRNGHAGACVRVSFPRTAVTERPAS